MPSAHASSLPYTYTYTPQLFAGAHNTSGFVDGPGLSARFNIAAGMTFGPSGDIYIADKGNNAIRKIDPNTGNVSTFLTGFTNDSLTRIAYDPINNGFYTLELPASNDTIISFVPFNSPSINNLCSTAAGFNDGAIGTAQFGAPRGLAVDRSTGDVYIADQGNHRIRKFQATTVVGGVVTAGNVTTFAGTGVNGSTDGPRTGGGAATLSSPYSIASDNAGIVYAGQTGGIGTSRIRKIENNQVTTFVPPTLTSPYLVFPSDFAIDSNGEVFVSEDSSSVVHKVTPQGVFTDIASTNAGATSILVSSDGITVYFSQGLFHTVRKMVGVRVLNGSLTNLTAGGNTTALGGQLTNTLSNILINNNTSSPFYGVGVQILGMSPANQQETINDLIPKESSPTLSVVGTPGKLPSMRMQAMRAASDAGVTAASAGFRESSTRNTSAPFSMAAMRGLAAFMNSSRGKDLPGNAFTNSLESKENIALVSEGSLQAIESQMEQAANAGASKGNLGFWLQPFFAPESQKSTDTSPAFKSNTGGLVMGLDTALRKNVLLGLAAGVTLTRITLERSRGKTAVNSFFLSPYGSFALGKIALDASLLLGTNAYDVERGIPTLGLQAKSKHTGYTFAPQIQLSHVFRLRGGLGLEPFVNLGYTLIQEKAYTETGAAPFNLTVHANKTTMLKTELGANVSKAVHQDDDRTVRLKGRLSYINRHLFKGAQSTFSLPGIGGPFTTTPGRRTQQLIAPGAGIELANKGGWSSSFNYDVQFGRGYLGQQVSLRFRKTFDTKSDDNGGALGEASTAETTAPPTATPPTTAPASTTAPATAAPSTASPAAFTIDPVRIPNKPETKTQKSIEIKTA